MIKLFGKKSKAVDEVDNRSIIDQAMDFFRGSPSSSGVAVTAKSAMGVPAINRGVHLICDMLSTLPLQVYTKNGRNIDKAVNHPQYLQFRYSMGGSMLTPQYLAFQERNIILYGNAFALKQQTSDRIIKRYIPIHPDNVVVDIKSGKKAFIVTDANGKKATYSDSSMAHYFNHSSDGVSGEGILTQLRDAIGLQISADQHLGGFFKNGAKATGYLSNEGKLSPEKVAVMRENWTKVVTGENKYGTPILDDKWQWNAMTVPNSEAQFAELKGFLVNEVARMLNIPSILLYHADTASTFASSKELVQAFLKFSLDPVLVRWENWLNMDLSGSVALGGKNYVKFSRAGIERMDLQTRTEAYSKMIAMRAMNPNEVRGLEEMNPYDGGDDFINPAISTTGGENNAK